MQLEKGVGNGKEFVLAGKPDFSWDDVVEFVKREFPGVAKGMKLQGPFEGRFYIETKRAESVLGVKWTEWQVTLKEVLEQQIALQKAAASASL